MTSLRHIIVAAALTTAAGLHTAPAHAQRLQDLFEGGNKPTAPREAPRAAPPAVTTPPQAPAPGPSALPGATQPNENVFTLYCDFKLVTALGNSSEHKGWRYTIFLDKKVWHYGDSIVLDAVG